MTYAEEILGPYRTRAQLDTDAARRLAETDRRGAAELRALLAGEPSPLAPTMPGLTPTQARALAEQVVAGQLGGTPGELAAAKAYLAKANII